MTISPVVSTGARRVGHSLQREIPAKLPPARVDGAEAHHGNPAQSSAAQALRLVSAQKIPRLPHTTAVYRTPGAGAR